MWRFKNPTRYSRRCYCHLSESATRHRVDGPAASACIATARDQDVSVFPPMQSLHCLVMVRFSEIHMDLVTSVLIGCVCVTSHILGQLVNSCRVEAKVVCSSGCTCSWDSSGCVTALVSEAVWKIGIQAKHWRFTGFLKHYENEGFHGFQISFTFSDARNIYSNLLEARSYPFLRCVHLWLISLVDLQSKATIFMAILFSTMGHSVYSPVSWNGIYSILGFSEPRHSVIPFPTKNVHPRIWSLLLHESIRPDEHPPHGHFDEAGILEDSPAMRGSKAFGFGKLSESVLTASRLFPEIFFPPLCCSHFCAWVSPVSGLSSAVRKWESFDRCGASRAASKYTSSFAGLCRGRQFCFRCRASRFGMVAQNHFSGDLAAVVQIYFFAFFFTEEKRHGSFYLNFCQSSLELPRAK